MAKKEPRKRGAARMAQLGKRLVQVWLDPQEYVEVSGFAAAQGDTVATFARKAAVKAARKLLVPPEVRYCPKCGYAR